MRTVPSILWYLEVQKGSGLTDRLSFRSKKWRLAYSEGMGSPPGEFSTVTNYEIDGAVVSSHTLEPRPIVLGVFYRGARTQKEYYEARRTLLDFVRPNQYVPVKLYVILPDHKTYFLEVYGSPGAPLPLEQERTRSFLEPVNFIANDPIWRSVEKTIYTLGLGTVASISVPNQATCVVSSAVNAVTHEYIAVNLGEASGSGGNRAGFYVDVKKSTQANNEYIRHDASASTSFIVPSLEELTTYNIRALAYNSAGTGTASSAITQATNQYVPPLRAPNIESSITPNSLTLSWAAVPNATGYQGRHKLATATSYTSWTDLTGTSYTLASLTHSTAYDFQIRATYTASGITTTGPEAIIQLTTEFAAAPGPVRNLVSVERTDAFAEYDWDAPNYGGAVSYYEWSWKGSHNNRAGTTTGTGVVFSRPSGSIRMRVKAIGPGGAGPTVTYEH